MKKRVFQYLVVFHEYEKSEKGEMSYKDSKIIIDPTYLLAKNDKEVLFKATREIDDKYSSDPENVEILIRDFR